MVIVKDDVLQRFRRFKAMFISSSVPNNELLEMIESFITADKDEPVVESVPVLDGQISLMELSNYKELMSA